MASSAANLPFEPLQDTVEANWSDLPYDMLETVSKQLHDVYDCVYFRSVCKSWNESTSMSNLPTLVPWLLCDTDDDGRLVFYSIFSNKTRTIHCPQSRQIEIYGPSLGYLYTIQNTSEGHEKCFLLNPMTKEEVPLQLRKYIHESNLISMSPSLIGDDNYMVFTDYDHRRIEFYQPQKPKQNFGGGHICFWLDRQGEDVCLKGMHFAHMKETCDTVLINIASKHLFVIPAPEMHSQTDRVAFVESEGKILRIVKHWKNHNLEPTAVNKYVFDIYQLVVEDEIQDPYKWVKINGIGNYVLFLDSCSASGISIEATESTGLRRNCIYYIESFDGICGWDNSIYRYDIDEGRSELIPCPHKRLRTWFVPSFVSLLPTN